MIQVYYHYCVTWVTDNGPAYADGVLSSSVRPSQQDFYLEVKKRIALHNEVKDPATLIMIAFNPIGQEETPDAPTN